MRREGEEREAREQQKEKAKEENSWKWQRGDGDWRNGSSSNGGISLNQQNE